VGCPGSIGVGAASRQQLVPDMFRQPLGHYESKPVWPGQGDQHRCRRFGKRCQPPRDQGERPWVAVHPQGVRALATADSDPGQSCENVLGSIWNVSVQLDREGHCSFLVIVHY
jgi:hypothetical protein